MPHPDGSMTPAESETYDHGPGLCAEEAAISICKRPESAGYVHGIPADLDTAVAEIDVGVAKMNEITRWKLKSYRAERTQILALNDEDFLLRLLRYKQEFDPRAEIHAAIYNYVMIPELIRRFQEKP